MTLFKSLNRICWMLTSAFIFAAGTSVTAQTQGKSRDIVLVHGAWVGEWYWRELVVGLQNAGHRAVAVSLAGHGKRVAEGGPHVSIEMHAQDIVRAIEDNGLNDIILLGHSYGGRPVTAAWDQLRAEVSHLVYVESVAPVSHERLAIPQDNASMRFVLQNYPAWVEGGMIPVPERLRQSYTQVLAPQSIRSVYGEVILKNGPLPDTPGTYVYATSSRAKIFRSYGKRLQDLRGWDLQPIPGAHNVMADGGKELLRVLLLIAEAN